MYTRVCKIKILSLTVQIYSSASIHFAICQAHVQHSAFPLLQHLTAMHRNLFSLNGLVDGKQAFFLILVCSSSDVLNFVV